MQLLYLAMYNSSSAGVSNKIISNIKHLNTIGIRTKGILVDINGIENRFDPELNIQHIPLKFSRLPFFYDRRILRFFTNYFKFNRFNRERYKVINEAIDEEKFDFIIFRYPNSNKHLLDFVTKHKGKIIFEHNTKEPDELKLNFTEKYPGYAKIVYRAEVKYAPRVLSNAAGIIGVTDEIVQFEKQRTRLNNLKTLTLTNSIDATTFPLRTTPDFDGKELRLLMVSNSDQPWQGIDLLLKSIARYSGNVIIKLRLVGNYSSVLRQLAVNLGLTQNVEFLGYISDGSLAMEFNNAHIAIGTLAIYRKNLKEASTLKIREYLSRGIPFVLGYLDPDLTELDNELYYQLNLRDESFIDFDNLINFTAKVYQIKNHNVLIREYARTHVDTSVKMVKLKTFLEFLAGNNLKH